jgi:hypothetical protein
MSRQQFGIKIEKIAFTLNGSQLINFHKNYNHVNEIRILEYQIQVSEFPNPELIFLRVDSLSNMTNSRIENPPIKPFNIQAEPILLDGNAHKIYSYPRTIFNFDTALTNIREMNFTVYNANMVQIPAFSMPPVTFIMEFLSVGEKRDEDHSRIFNESILHAQDVVIDSNLNNREEKLPNVTFHPFGQGFK